VASAGMRGDDPFAHVIASTTAARPFAIAG
jgi:hypothetical protein